MHSSEEWTTAEVQAWIAQCRDEATQWARAVLADERVILLDTETTGLHGDVRMVEIAVIDTQGGTLLNTRINPGIPIPCEASAIHCIRDEEVASCLSIPEVWPQIEAAVRDRRVLIYNAQYDRGVIANCAQVYGLGMPTEIASAGCLMNWYAHWCGAWDEYRESFRWQRLPDGDHTALGDCRAALECLRAMAADEDD